jgi:transposase-like protein
MKEKYPETVQEFAKRFAEDENCYDYLVKLRWGEDFKCIYCKHKVLWKCDNGRRYRCQKCHKDISVTAGTSFEGRHLSIQTWFYVLWFMVLQKVGVSAIGLAKSLGIKRQMTVWSILQKVRKSVSQKGKSKLSGTVEVDEVFIGGIQKGKRLVPGKVRIVTVDNATSETLLKNIQDMVTEGSLIRTDDLPSYNLITKHKYKHEVIKKDASKDPNTTPLVHLIASLLKRWLLGTHQGGVHLHNLQFYLDEYVFRFNRRKSHSRGMLFYRLVQAMLGVKGD